MHCGWVRTELRGRVPAAVEEDEHRLDVVLLADVQELVYPLQETLGEPEPSRTSALRMPIYICCARLSELCGAAHILVLNPQEIVEEDADGVHSCRGVERAFRGA